MRANEIRTEINVQIPLKGLMPKVRQLGKSDLMKEREDFCLGMNPVKFVFFRSITGINDPGRLRIKFGSPKKLPDLDERVLLAIENTFKRVKG